MFTDEQKAEMQALFAEHMANRRATNKLRERNLKIQKRNLTENSEIQDMRESFKRKFGFDFATDTEKFPVLRESFSFKKAQREIEAKMREADSSSAFAQFLKAGLQTIVADGFMNTETTYEDWVTVVPSKQAEEPYAPSHGVSFPREVGAQMPYPEVAAAALDLKLKNKKYGGMYTVEKELLEDDQTGQFQRNGALLGEYLKVLVEVLCYGKLASAAGMSYAGFDVPTSETKPSYEENYPWSTSLRGGGATKPASFGALSQSNIQAGIIALGKQKNLNGLFMGAKAKRIIASPAYQFDLAVLLNSSFYPTGAGAAGAIAGNMAINPIKGLVDVTLSPYLFDNAGQITGTSKAWYLVDDSKPFFVLQQRTPVGMEQENPQSGESFNRDVYRFKGFTRCNADFIDPRYAWQGSDGSV